MNISFKQFIARLTEGHTILGLALSAVLYLICITGTFAVFYAEIERWESPNIPEFSVTNNDAIAKAALEAQKIMIADKSRPALYHDLYMSLPNSENPRLLALYGEESLAFDENGNYIGKAHHNLTHFLTELHYYLHLPESFGMIVVSILGVFMLSLLIGGALSHKRMFRDAFTLRGRSGSHLTKSDLHNRIGTWTLPFTIIVTATGAFIGLAQVMLLLVATFFDHGDMEKAMEPMFGSKAEFTKITNNQPFNGKEAIVNSLNNLKLKYPNETPIYLVIADATEETPRIEIMAKVPERVIYGESYRFDAQGNLRASQGMKDGDIGKIIYGSLFPLHFGNFGGYIVKVIYFFLGIILCLMINAGMDIWFTKSAAKKRPHEILHLSWVGFVYGCIISIFAAMTMGIIFPNSEKVTFWCGLIAINAISVITAKSFNIGIKDLGAILRLISGIAILCLALAHYISTSSSELIAIIPDIILLLSGITYIYSAIKSLKSFKKQ